MQWTWELTSSMIFPNETAISPRAMTMLDLMEGSLLVSRILRRSNKCPSQYCPETHMSFVKASVAASRSEGDCHQYRPCKKSRYTHPIFPGRSADG
jgi:hypothetical protein